MTGGVTSQNKAIINDVGPLRKKLSLM